MKNPVAASFLVALLSCVVLAGVALAVYSAQEVPWMLGLVVLAFPFVWFAAWILANGAATWRQMSGGSHDRDPG